MIILGIVALVIYFLLLHNEIVLIIGVLLILVGIGLAISGRSGREIGGRSHWY